MIRKTSRAAYDEIVEKGLLRGLQFEVYSVLFNNGPLTQNELHMRYFPTTQPRNVQPRVSELEAMGAVEAVGERPCSITGRVCMVWDVTGKLPHEPAPRANSKSQVIAELVERIESLEKQVQELKAARYDANGQGDLFSMRGH